MLSSITTRFYKSNSSSFSSTRSRPWAGWYELAKFLRTQNFGEDILDIASGNLRFENFLQSEFSDKQFKFVCVDNCSDLTRGYNTDSINVVSNHLEFIDVDIIECLLNSELIVPLDDKIQNNKFDLVVSFGFMHHIPGSALRMSFITKLFELAKSGGFIAISFWRFADDPRFYKKAKREHQNAMDYLFDSSEFSSTISNIELETGDFLLGWNNKSATFRYCHSFSEEEIENIVDMSKSYNISLAHRFRADGRTEDANEYLVFQKLS